MGRPRRFDGAIHGFVAWGLSTLVTFWLLGTAVGSVISGVTGVVGQGLQAVRQGVTAVVPENVNVQAEPIQNLSLQQIHRQARALLRQADLQDDVAQAVDTVQAEARDIARKPGSVEQDLDRALQELMETGSEADRQEVIDILTANTGLNQQQARRTVQRYERQFQQVQRQFSQALDCSARRHSRPVARPPTCSRPWAGSPSSPCLSEPSPLAPAGSWAPRRIHAPDTSHWSEHGSSLWGRGLRRCAGRCPRDPPRPGYAPPSHR